MFRDLTEHMLGTVAPSVILRLKCLTSFQNPVFDLLFCKFFSPFSSFLLQLPSKRYRFWRYLFLLFAAYHLPVWFILNMTSSSTWSGLQGAKYTPARGIMPCAAVICREALKMCGRCAARHDLLPCLDCQNDPKSFDIGGKSMSNLLLQCTTIFIFNLTCFLCHQSSRENHRFPNCMGWSLDGSEDVYRHLVIKRCTASSYLARHENCTELQKRKHAEKRKKTEDEPVEHSDCSIQKLCENRCSIIYVITHVTRLRLDGIELQWTSDNTVTGLVSWLRFTVPIAMWILIAFPGRPEIK